MSGSRVFLTQDDIIIVVMGPTGAGKSTFIQYAIEEEPVLPNHESLLPSRDIRLVKSKRSINGRPIVFVDTPGVGDIYTSNTGVLAQVSDWLQRIYGRNLKLHSIFYLHRISDNRMSRLSLADFELFASTCTNTAVPNVTLITTMWKHVPKEKGEEREKELKSCFWNETTDQGCTVRHFDDSIDSALDIVSSSLGKAVLLPWSMDSRTPSVEINASIEVVKRKYWAGLATGVNFSGKRLQAYLDAIHTDITDLWEQKDPHGLLKSKKFRAMMSSLVGERLEEDIPEGDKAGIKKPHNPNKSLVAGLAAAGATIGVAAGLSGPAGLVTVPIVASVAGGIALGKWAHDVYKTSQKNLERLMAYIVDLTLVMQNVFWLAEGKHLTSFKRIKLAFDTYCDSTKADVHREITDYVKQSKIYNPKTRDRTLDKLVMMVNWYKIDSMEMWKSRVNTSFKGSESDDS